jgi:hypothetical protein
VYIRHFYVTVICNQAGEVSVFFLSIMNQIGGRLCAQEILIHMMELATHR